MVLSSSSRDGSISLTGQGCHTCHDNALETALSCLWKESAKFGGFGNTFNAYRDRRLSKGDLKL